MTTLVSSQITIGSYVRLKKNQTERIKAYGEGPFKVIAQIDQDHVSLEDTRGNPVHFGSGDQLSFHVGNVEPW